MKPDFLIVKVGGSLFSDKGHRGSLNEEAMAGFAKQFARLASSYRGRLIMVSGGGALGHGAIRDGGAVGALSLVGLSEATFEVKKRWAARLRDAGASAFPLQLAAMCTLSNGAPEFRSTVLAELLKRGILPVLAGDALFDEDGRLHAFSSDRVPEALMPLVAGKVRVVAFTDVDGIISGGDRKSVV